MSKGYASFTRNIKKQVVVNGRVDTHVLEDLVNRVVCWRCFRAGIWVGEPYGDKAGGTHQRITGEQIGVFELELLEHGIDRIAHATIFAGNYALAMGYGVDANPHLSFRQETTRSIGHYC